MSTRSAASPGQLLGKVWAGGGAWHRGALVVALLALAGAWLVVELMAYNRSALRIRERGQILQRTAQALIGQTKGGGLLGAAALLGLSESALKDQALGRSPPNAPEVLARMGLVRGRFLVSDVYVLSLDGTVVANDTAGTSAVGTNLAFRPYFKQAIKGAANAYAGLGFETQERGIYYAAPIYEGDFPASRVIGVVALKVAFEAFDTMLASVGHPMLLMSPQGVAFASSRPEWQYAMAPPLTQERIDLVRGLRQFGRRFDNGVASALPFRLEADEAQIDGITYAVARRDIEWNDPGGMWQLVMLDDVSALMPAAQRLRTGALAFAVLALLGGLVLDMVRTRTRMKAQQERLRVLGAALGCSPVAVVITDPEGYIDWVNPQYERKTGFSLGEVRGRKPSIVASEQTATETYRDMWAHLLAGKSWQGHFVNRRKDGTLFHDESTLSPVLDEKGRRIAIVGLQEDVTQRMQASKELEQRARLLNELLEQQKAFFDSAPPIALVCEGQFRQFNPAFAELMRGTSSRLQGLRVQVLFRGHEGYAAFMARTEGALSAGESVQENATLFRLDGTPYEARMTGRRLRMEGILHASLWVIEDVTEQRRLERLVADQLAVQLALVDAIPVPLFYKGTDGRYIGFNRAYEQAFGVRRDELIGKTVRDLDFLPEADRERFDRDTAAALVNHQCVHKEVDLPYADGTVHHAMFWLHGFSRSDGTPGGAIGTFVDITDREHAEQALRRAKEHAEEAVARKSEFLLTMIHTIRMPMSAIISMSHLALQSGLDQRQSDYVCQIQQAGLCLQSVIDGILDFSRIESGMLSIEKQPFALDRMLEGVAGEVDDKAGAKGGALVLDVAADVPRHLVGDALRLGQILVNFVNHVIKFTEKGEVHMLVRLEDSQGSRVVLRFDVRDTGTDMPSEQLTRLFQGFRQADVFTMRRYGGTDLGLAICKSLAELMGGEVGANSAPGKGSSFWVTLPLERGEAPHPPPA